MISHVSRYMAGLGEQRRACGERWKVLSALHQVSDIQEEQGQGILRARRRRHGYLPLSDGASTFVSGWG
jgi:hypothetical protein